MDYIPAALSGFFLTMSFPNMQMPWLAWAALSPMLISIRYMDRKKAFYAGLVMGFAHFFSLLYWIVPTISTYGQIPLYLSLPVLFLLAFYLALYPGLFAFGINLIDAGPLIAPITGAMLWVSLEYIRAGLFSGFPWGLTGYSQYMHLPLIQIADMTGVYGLSFLIVLTNGVAAILFCGLRGFYFEKKSRSRSIAGADIKTTGSGKGISAAEMRPEKKTIHLDKSALKKSGFKPNKFGWKTLLFWIISLAVLFQAVFFYGHKRLNEIRNLEKFSPKTSISVIQGNIRQVMKWDDDYKLHTIKKYCNLSLDTALYSAIDGPEDKPDLIIWPETALPFYYEWDKALSDEVDACIREAKTNFLIGSPAFKALGNDTYRFFNRAYMINRLGIVTGWYDKTHLVPFGEYVPLGKYLFFLGKIIAQAGDFSPGTLDASPLKFHEYRAGVLICFEIIFPYLARNAVNRGADILVTMTNDAWFGNTSAPMQHFSMAVFRAVENRRAVARAANTGISGFISPGGKIMDKSSLYCDAALKSTLSCFRIKTFYTEKGDLFALICMIAIVMAFMIKLLKLKIRHFRK